MSASREKKTRQDLTGTGWNDPKTAREAAAQKADKRTNAMYTLIAVVFVLVAAAAIIWRSNIIPKTVTAVTVDGENYKASEVSMYYKNVVRGFMTPDNYQLLGYLGVNMNAPLDGQTMSETAAKVFDCEPGTSWKDYFLEETMQQIAEVQAVLKTAEEEGFVYPDSVQQQYDQAMEDLKTAAASSNVSVNKYLQSSMGRTMNESIYSEHLLRMLKHDAYMEAYADSLTYTDEQISSAYKADSKQFDKVHYESIIVDGTAEMNTDADGNPVPPTDEENAAAKAAAKAAADQMLTSWKSGSSLESLADGNEKADYSDNQKSAYAASSTVSEWLFDDSRKAGDAAVLETGSTYTLVVFRDRFRESGDTINVRHILIRPEASQLTSSDEGYADEQAKLKADAKAKAEEILNQWKSGEATEDSFAQLAVENSADSNAAQGGLYTQVAQGDMVDTFNDWCFENGRKAGDTGIVETDFGYHIMYFVGTDLPKWKADVTASLKNDDYTAWSEQFGADYTKEIHSFGAKFVA